MEHELGPLPEWSPDLELSERAIDRFVYSNEPAGEMGQEFRVGLAAAIAEAVAAERERCAKVCEGLSLIHAEDSLAEPMDAYSRGLSDGAYRCSKAIRVTPNDRTQSIDQD